MEPTTDQTQPEPKVKKSKMVKIKLLRDCMVGEGFDSIRKAGTICEVSEEHAKELCDKGFDGYLPFYGYMPEIGPLMGEGADGSPLPNPLDRKKIYRAVRVA